MNYNDDTHDATRSTLTGELDAARNGGYDADLMNNINYGERCATCGADGKRHLETLTDKQIYVCNTCGGDWF